VGKRQLSRQFNNKARMDVTSAGKKRCTSYFPTALWLPLREGQLSATLSRRDTFTLTSYQKSIRERSSGCLWLPPLPEIYLASSEQQSWAKPDHMHQPLCKNLISDDPSPIKHIN